MTGSHGCGTWKKSKKTKGYYKPIYNQDTGKWYTVTSTKELPMNYREISKTWSGARYVQGDRGKDIQLAGGRYSGLYFQFRGTGSSSGADVYKVYGLDGTRQTREMLEYFGIPYNDVWTEGTGVYGIRVPGGALADKGWPWSGKFGWPTKYSFEYWVWTEYGTPYTVTKAEFDDWVLYINVAKEITPEEKRQFYTELYHELLQTRHARPPSYTPKIIETNEYLDYLLAEHASNFLDFILEQKKEVGAWGEDDLLVEFLKDIKAFGFSAAIDVQLTRKQQQLFFFIQELEETLENYPEAFNKFWFGYYGYYTDIPRVGG